MLAGAAVLKAMVDPDVYPDPGFRAWSGIAGPEFASRVMGLPSHSAAGSAPELGDAKPAVTGVMLSPPRAAPSANRKNILLNLVSFPQPRYRSIYLTSTVDVKEKDGFLQAHFRSQFSPAVACQGPN